MVSLERKRIELLDKHISRNHEGQILICVLVFRLALPCEALPSDSCVKPIGKGIFEEAKEIRVFDFGP